MCYTAWLWRWLRASTTRTLSCCCVAHRARSSWKVIRTTTKQTSQKRMLSQRCLSELCRTVLSLPTATWVTVTSLTASQKLPQNSRGKGKAGRAQHPRNSTRYRYRNGTQNKIIECMQKPTAVPQTTTKKKTDWCAETNETVWNTHTTDLPNYRGDWVGQATNFSGWLIKLLKIYYTRPPPCA